MHIHIVAVVVLMLGERASRLQLTALRLLINHDARCHSASWIISAHHCIPLPFELGLEAAARDDYSVPMKRLRAPPCRSRTIAPRAS